MIKTTMLIRSAIVFFALCISSVVYALPEINTWTTGNGIKVLHVNSPELPMVDIALTLDAGSARDNELAGLSAMMHGLLDKGTGKLDADDVASRFEDVGAQFSASVDLDRSSVTLRSLTDEEFFNDALTMFINVVSKPSFPERDFDREKKRLLISLEDSDQRPSDIVGRKFFELLYQQHPYAQPRSGTKESANKITLKDVKKFHDSYFVATNSILAIVGNVSEQQAKDIAKKISESLLKGKAQEKIALVKPSVETKQHIDFPSQQSHVRMGQIGVERGNPDYFNLYVGNHILGGGGFTSRLVKEVRSNRGLSYSVYSYFLPYAQSGPFMLGLQTRADQVTEAIQVCNEVLADFIENGPTQEELALSKQNIMNGFPLRVDSNRDILGYLSLIGYYDLPLNYLDDFTKNIENVSLEDVQKAFRKQLDLDTFVTVVVGSEQKPEEDA
ncbi:MAG: M16 family metallopeptidase [Gammaproteobacteria bacterium]